MPLAFDSYEDMAIDELIKTHNTLYNQYWYMPLDEDKSQIIGEQLVACRWEIKRRGYINWDGSIRDDAKAQECESPIGQKR